MVKEIATRTPTFYVTFEDLKLNPEPVLIQMFSFLLETDITGTVIEARI